jgi:hypothetical protein
MIKKKKKYDYYKLDVGFFPDVMKLCFDNKVFQQILKDHDVTLKASALDIGIAETHMVGDGRDAVIVLVFDMASVENDGELIDIIAHEVSHAVDHLADHIGEEDNFVGETRAYLTGHLAGQIYKICMSEKEKNARKANRKISGATGKRQRGPNVQVDLHSDGSAGSVSTTQTTGILRGAQNGDGQAIRSPDPSI